MWIDTFATTGPRTPYGIAASPKGPAKGDIFVATFTGTILRYHSNGQPTAHWESFNVPPDGNPVESVLFDPHTGDLWVATYFGESGYVANLYRYAAQDLVLPNPQPVDTIATGLRRGNQMAFDQQGNLCVASYFGQTVRCFDTGNHAQTFDYNAELAASGIFGVESRSMPESPLRKRFPWSGGRGTNTACGSDRYRCAGSGERCFVRNAEW